MLVNSFLKLRVVVSCPQFSYNFKIGLEIVYPCGGNNEIVKNSARYKENSKSILSERNDLSPVIWDSETRERSYEFTFSKMGVVDNYDKIRFKKHLYPISNNDLSTISEILINTSKTDVTQFEVCNQSESEDSKSQKIKIIIFVDTIGYIEKNDCFYELFF